VHRALYSVEISVLYIWIYPNVWRTAFRLVSCSFHNLSIAQQRTHTRRKRDSSCSTSTELSFPIVRITFLYLFLFFFLSFPLFFIFLFSIFVWGFLPLSPIQAIHPSNQSSNGSCALTMFGPLFLCCSISIPFSLLFLLFLFFLLFLAVYWTADVCLPHSIR
jgi:hypothetical protein